MRIHTALVVAALGFTLFTPTLTSVTADVTRTPTGGVSRSTTTATGRTPQAGHGLAASPDDSNWLPMGTELGAHASSFAVFSLYQSSLGLFAGGTFYNIGGPQSNYIARWNGNAWQSAGTGINNAVITMIDYGGDLVAGGWFTTAGSDSVHLIASWDGANWSPIGSGFIGVRISALAVFGGELFAGGEGFSGNYIMSRWNGASWAGVGSSPNGTVRALLPYNGNLIAGGDFTAVDGVTVSHIAKWNGSSWSALGAGTNGSVLALAEYNGDLIVGGDYNLADGVTAHRIARWNGSNWFPLGSGLGPDLSGIQVRSLAVYCNDLYAAGVFFLTGVDSVFYVARWDGATWNALGTGTNGDVNALALQADTLIVGGQFNTAGGKSTEFVARWIEPRLDADMDCFVDSVDNCPLVSNPGQEDADFNGVGDACDVGDSIVFAVYSPINMVVTDPAGDSIGIDSVSGAIFNTIQNGATYDTLTDENSSDLTGPDGDPDDIVSIANPMAGAYSVRLYREEGASDSAHFTHGIRINGNQQLVPDEYRDATVSALGTPEVPSVVVYTAATTLPGDVNADGVTTSSDIIYMVNYVFKGGVPPVVPNHGDVNCDGVSTSSDIIYLVNYTFKGGLSPCSQTGG